MCEMVITMPGIQSKTFSEVIISVMLRMVKRPFKLFIRKTFKKGNPSLVSSFQHSHGRFYRHMEAVLKFCPLGFVIGLNCGIIFRKSKFKTDKAVDMAVRKMINKLSYRPSSFSVWGIQLIICKMFNEIF